MLRRKGGLVVDRTEPAYILDERTMLENWLGSTRATTGTPTSSANASTGR
jgi:hypothetical protein